MPLHGDRASTTISNGDSDSDQADQEALRQDGSISTNASKRQVSIPLQEFSRPIGPPHDESMENLLRNDRTWSTTPPSAHRKPHILHPSMWLWEIASLLLAVSILVTMIVILRVYNNKRSPIFIGLTLNTIVAFASTLFRICLMVPVTVCVCQLGWSRMGEKPRSLNDLGTIDGASRGPIGSLELLMRLSFRYVQCIFLQVVSPQSSSLSASFLKKR